MGDFQVDGFSKLIFCYNIPRSIKKYWYLSNVGNTSIYKFVVNDAMHLLDVRML
jgi:hypothetical protein